MTDMQMTHGAMRTGVEAARRVLAKMGFGDGDEQAVGGEVDGEVNGPAVGEVPPEVDGQDLVSPATGTELQSDVRVDAKTEA